MGAQGVAGPVVAVTGTPGTGKTSACRLLAASGASVLDLARFRGDARFDLGTDEARSDTHVLDEEAIDAHLATHLAAELEPAGAGTGPIFIEGHFAHVLDVVDRILILRCRPSVLRERLASRGWSEAKIRENLEAEGMDLILQEAVATRDAAATAGRNIVIGEIDTTGLGVAATAERIRVLASAEPVNLEIGRLDWSDEVLGWY